MDNKNQIKETALNREHLKMEAKMKATKTIKRKKTKSYLAIILTAGVLAVGLGLVTHPFSAEARGPFGIQKSPELIIERLTDRLGLTDEQVLAIQPIIEEKVQKMNEIRSNRGTDRQATRMEMQKLRWDTESKLNTILNEEQIEKYLELRQEQRGTFLKGKFCDKRMSRGFNKTPEMVIERMTDRFNLTAEQAEAIEPIIEESMEKKRAIFDNYGEKRFDVKQAMRSEMQIVGDETEAKLSTILTDEQIEELRDFRDQRHQWKDKRMNRPGHMGF